MSLFLSFDDIENDDDQEKARQLFKDYRGECTCTIELLELRHDIVKGFIKPGNLHNFD